MENTKKVFMLSPINTYNGMFKQKRFEVVETPDNNFTIIDRFRERNADDTVMLETFVRDVLNADLGVVAKSYRLAAQIDVSSCEFWLDMNNFIIATK